MDQSPLTVDGHAAAAQVPLADAAASVQRKTIDAIAIVTRHRPGMVARALDGVCSQLTAHRRHAEILVVDDSREDEARAQTAVAARQAAGRHGASIQYSDQAARNAFADRLAIEAGVSPDIARFLFQNPFGYSVSVGACRNTVLAAAPGRTVLFIDDDIIPRVAPIPGSTEAISTAGGGFQSWFLDPRWHADEFTCASENVFDIHERALNRAPSMRVSMLGLLGDAATNDPLIYFLQGPETVARLARDPERYAAAMTNRLVLCGPLNTLVARHLACMSYCMAIDHSVLLPPFFPIARGEEFVFGALVTRCVPGALFAASPWAVLHLPPDPRQFESGAAASRAGTFTLSETIAALIGQQRLSDSTTESRLGSMSARLAGLLTLDDDELRARIGEMVAPALRAQASAVEAALELARRSAPCCVPDLSRVREAYQSALHDGWDHSHPRDAESTHASGGTRPFRELLSAFCAALHEWPRIVRAAQALRRNGVTPFCRVAPA
jgi:hypothetical protein